MILRRCSIRAPAFAFLAVALLAKVACAAEMPLGAIIMQLRSTVDANNTTELNERFRDVTTKYLNDYFGAYYTRTEQMPKNYFSEASLSMNSFGVYGLQGSFITTIEIEGSLSFNSDTLPSGPFIDTLLRNAFKGRNEQLYLDKLLKSKDGFLQNLTLMIIDINKSDTAESPTGENGTGTTTETGDASGSNDEEPDGRAKRTSSEKWILAVICITSIVLSGLLLFCSRLLYRRCNRRKETEDARNDSDSKEPMKVIKLPVKQQSSSSRTSTSAENMKFDKNKISPTSTETTRSSPDCIGAKMDRPAPSPQRSLTSQASSVFTYTDNMSRFTTHNKTSQSLFKTAGSPFSKFSLDVPSIDLSMWRGGRQDPPAFVSDISVIAKQNDLSLIPEERDDIETGWGNNKENNFRTSNRNNRRLSQKSRVALDARQSKSRFSNRSETYFYNGQNDDNDSDAGHEMTADDVICDLRNLSMQIQQQRKSARSKRAVNR